MAKFAHLHVASCFSQHWGTTWPEALVQAQQDNPAAALTDRDNASGIVRHIRACLSAGVAPVAGADLLVDDGSEITVLAHGGDHGHGWACLSRMISAAHANARPRRDHRPAQVTRQRLREILTGGEQPGCTVLLGPGSDVGTALLRGDPAQALARIRAWQRLLGNVVVEVVCHYTRPGRPASVPHAADLLQAGMAAEVPVVVTNAVRYLTPEDAIVRDVLDAAGHLLPLTELNPEDTGEAWLKPPPLMGAVIAEVVRATGLPPSTTGQLTDQTIELAAHCALDPDTDLGWRRAKVPELDVINLTGDPEHLLAERCRAALPERWPRPSSALKQRLLGRLDDELAVISSFGFGSYFLVVADIVDMIRDMGVRVQARGSGAGSLVNYLLRVSTVDPIEHDLLFERFLGIQRSTLPDIDIDVESARRHDIYRAITTRYGPHRVTLLGMHNQYRARGAVRDAGLALGLDPEQIDSTAKSLWRLNAADIAQALTERPELVDLAQSTSTDPRLRALFDLSRRLDRLPRHMSMHPCGVILSDQNLLSLTPTQPSGIGIAMSQFDKDDIDDLGLLKLDVLGVRMQSAIAHTLEQIRLVSGQEIDLERIPRDDPATFATIQSAHTLGMFQIESPGQRELVGKMQPSSMTDLVADISLFRPGPMKSNMITPYVEAKLGFRSTPCLHPRFRSFLSDAHGVVIYHEHILRIIADTMGVTLAQADEIRRRLASDTEVIEQQFRTSAANRTDPSGRRLFTDKQVENIWSTLREFGSFGFCKAHAAAFAVTTYESAWLKTHHPAEFMAGLLEHDPGMYPQRLLLAEAKRLGVPILGVDANLSNDHYHIEPIDGQLGIRVPFTQIVAISDAEVRRLVGNQPYTSVTDLLQRARPHRPTAAKLAAIGALDSLTSQPSRGEVIGQVSRLTATGTHTAPETQDPLIGEDGTPAFPLPQPDTLATEVAVLGLDVTSHILDPWRGVLDQLDVTYADQLLNLRNNSLVTVAGVRVASQTPPMRSGKRVVFISLDDGTGVADCAFFPDAQHQVGPDLFRARLLAVQGRTRRTGAKGISITAETAWDLARWARPETTDTPVRQ